MRSFNDIRLRIIFLIRIACILAAVSNSGWAQSTSASHIFPEWADGRFGDGSSYRSTLVVTNSSTRNFTNCVLEIRGVGPQRFTNRDGLEVIPDGNRLAFSVRALGIAIFQSAGSGRIGSGYAKLTCDQQVDAIVLFSYYTPTGAKFAEATVFSSPRIWSTGQLVVDNRGGAKTAFAIAVDDQNTTGEFDLIVRNARGDLIGQARLTVPTRSQIAGFIDDVVPLPQEFVGRAIVVPRTPYWPTYFMIGLRFTNTTFTTIPATQCYDGALCAAGELP